MLTFMFAELLFRLLIFRCAVWIWVIIWSCLLLLHLKIVRPFWQGMECLHDELVKRSSQFQLLSCYIFVKDSTRFQKLLKNNSFSNKASIEEWSACIRERCGRMFIWDDPNLVGDYRIFVKLEQNIQNSLRI